MERLLEKMQAQLKEHGEQSRNASTATLRTIDEVGRNVTRQIESLERRINARFDQAYQVGREIGAVSRSMLTHRLGSQSRSCEISTQMLSQPSSRKIAYQARNHKERSGIIYTSFLARSPLHEVVPSLVRIASEYLRMRRKTTQTRMLVRRKICAS